MSSTLMVCHICGGVKAGATASAVGKRCTCTSGGGTSVATAGGASTHVGGKACCVCGVDVTDKKRMKDSTTGRYWCYECFIVEQRKKQPGMTMNCPHCHKDFPPLKMVKHGEAYWCEACHEQLSSKKAKKKPADTVPNGSARESAKPQAEGGSRASLIAGAVVVLVLAGIAYYMFLM